MNTPQNLTAALESPAWLLLPVNWLPSPDGSDPWEEFPIVHLDPAFGETAPPTPNPQTT